MPAFCAASASGPTGKPTTPNINCTPCSFRLFASKSAPVISAMFPPVIRRPRLDPVTKKSERWTDYAFMAARQMARSTARLRYGASAVRLEYSGPNVRQSVVLGFRAGTEKDSFNEKPENPKDQRLLHLRAPARSQATT